MEEKGNTSFSRGGYKINGPVYLIDYVERNINGIGEPPPDGFVFVTKLRRGKGRKSKTYRVHPEEAIGDVRYAEVKAAASHAISSNKLFALGRVLFAYQSGNKTVNGFTGPFGERRWYIRLDTEIKDQRLWVLMSAVLPSIGVNKLKIAKMLGIPANQIKYPRRSQTSLQFSFDTKRGFLVEDEVLIKPGDSISEGPLKDLLKMVIPVFGLMFNSDGRLVSARTKIEPHREEMMQTRTIRGVEIRGWEDDLTWLERNLEYTYESASDNPMVVLGEYQTLGLSSGECLAYLRKQSNVLQDSHLKRTTEVIQFTFDPQKGLVEAKLLGRKRAFFRANTKARIKDEFIQSVLRYLLPQLGVPREKQSKILGNSTLDFYPGNGQVKVTASEDGSVSVYVGTKCIKKVAQTETVPESMRVFVKRILRDQGFVQHAGRIVKKEEYKILQQEKKVKS